MNDNAPRVGEPSTDFDCGCSFSLKPGDPRCTADATRHVRVISLDWGEVALATCDTHASIARASGVHHDEHPFGAWCGFPETTWEGDRCEPAERFG